MPEGDFNAIFSKRLRHYLNERNMTQNELAKRIGVGSTSVYNWCNGIKSPRMDKVDAMCKIFNCRRSDLMEDKHLMPTMYSVNKKEYEHIEKYRSLDQHGQETVSYILERELDHKNQIESARNSKQTVIDYPTRFMTYYHNLASAGTGEYIFDDLPIDTIEIPANELSERADFVIGVNGDSMEPTYYDGDKVYVEKCPSVEIGEIGIFMVNNECFIKEVGKDGLISHNKKYSLIPGGDNVQCIGKVLGKVEE